jgi:putative oxidoreductase
MKIQMLAPRLGQALLGLLFLLSGLAKLGKFEAIGMGLAAKGIPWPTTALALVIAIEIAGGAALVLDRRARPAAAALALLVIPATLLFHAFWAADASALQNQLNHFLKNVAILGALLTIAGSQARA